MYSAPRGSRHRALGKQGDDRGHESDKEADHTHTLYHSGISALGMYSKYILYIQRGIKFIVEHAALSNPGSVTSLRYTLLARGDKTPHGRITVLGMLLLYHTTVLRRRSPYRSSTCRNQAQVQPRPRSIPPIPQDPRESQAARGSYQSAPRPHLVGTSSGSI